MTGPNRELHFVHAFESSHSPISCSHRTSTWDASMEVTLPANSGRSAASALCTFEVLVDVDVQ